MAFSALRDQNRIPIWWGLSSVDGVTPVAIAVNPVSGRVVMEDGTSTSAVISHLNVSLPRDDNRIPCIGGQADNDSTVLIPVSVNPTTGAILVKST